MFCWNPLKWILLILYFVMVHVLFLLFRISYSVVGHQILGHLLSTVLLSRNSTPSNVIFLILVIMTLSLCCSLDVMVDNWYLPSNPIIPFRKTKLYLFGVYFLFPFSVLLMTFSLVVFHCWECLWFLFLSKCENLNLSNTKELGFFLTIWLISKG